MQSRSEYRVTRVLLALLAGLPAACGLAEPAGSLAAMLRPSAETQSVSAPTLLRVGADPPGAILVTPQGKLVPGSGWPGDEFGQSVAIDGDTALVGAPEDDDNGENAGAAYLFVRTGGVWTEQAKLLPSDGAPGDRFGHSVAIDGDTALVGAPQDDDPADDAGSAYVFVRSGGVWTEEVKLLASDNQPPGAAYLFGDSVAIDGDTALVGAPFEGGEWFQQTGAGYVYVRTAGVWTEEAKIVVSTRAKFGASVALQGDTAIVGDPDPGFDPIFNEERQGAAYVFVRAGGIWTQQGLLLASDGEPGDYVGESVAIYGDTALVGSRHYHQTDGSGAAHVFVRNGNLWNDETELLPNDTPLKPLGPVALSEDVALLGMPAGDMLYVFTRNIATRVHNTEPWIQEGRFPASDGGKNFSRSLAMSGSTVIAGADGAAYVFSVERAATCALASDCASGFCADGVCCDSECGGGMPNDCFSCNEPGLAGVCTVMAAGKACREAAGGCDSAEQCDGTSTECPADAVAPAGSICRAGAGVCNGPELCDGTSPFCPPSAVNPAGTECRAARGPCDSAEQCDGTNVDCPADSPARDGTPCPGGVCMAAVCQPDPPEAGCACRAAATAQAGPAWLWLFGLVPFVRRRAARRACFLRTRHLSASSPSVVACAWHVSCYRQRSGGLSRNQGYRCWMSGRRSCPQRPAFTPIRKGATT